jgi:ribosomal protein L11
VLPAQDAKPVPPITPILGQAGVNATQFCLFFNKVTGEGETQEEQGFPLNVEISILGGNRFTLRFNDPSVGLLYNITYTRKYV